MVGCLKGTVVIIDFEKDCVISSIACTQNAIQSLNWISQMDDKSMELTSKSNTPQISIYFEIETAVKSNDREYIKVDIHVNYEKIQEFHSFDIYPYEPLNLVFTSITYNTKIITFPSHRQQKSLILAGSTHLIKYLNSH